MRYTCLPSIFFLFAVLSAPSPSLAQKPSTAREAYDHVQQLRSDAHKFWTHGAPRGDLEESVKILQAALDYLDDPLVMDLARGDIYLRGRRSDVLKDLSITHALLGNKTEATDYLSRMLDAGMTHFVTDDLRKSSTFDSIRQEPEFKEILKKLDAQGRRWDEAALKTAYRENLSDDEKVAGLSLFWSEVKYNFANFDRIPELDWNKLYLTYLPKVRATKTTLEYYRVLEEMCAQLKDGHTNIYPPKELEDAFYSRPPIRAALIEDKVILTEVRSESLLQSGIRPGLEIVSIDGVPVRRYAEDHVAPYESSSTKQDLEVRTYTTNLLAGHKDQPVNLELRDESGLTFKRSVPRSGFTDVKIPPTFEFKVLDGKIGYVSLSAFESRDIIKSFDAVFDDLARTDALIIDVRSNGGGDGGIGYSILGYLTNKPFQTNRWKTPIYSAAYRAWGLGGDQGWDREPVHPWDPNGKKFYDKPIVLLTSARTFSAAEDFVVAFDYMKRGKIIGEPTGGSTGQPMLFSLPGGGEARVCTKRDTYPDGKEFVGVGVQPDILVRRTAKGIRLGQDEVLDAAIKHLKETRKPD